MVIGHKKGERYGWNTGLITAVMPAIVARCDCGSEVHRIDTKDKFICTSCWARRIESAGRPVSPPVSSLNSLSTVDCP